MSSRDGHRIVSGLVVIGVVGIFGLFAIEKNNPVVKKNAEVVCVNFEDSMQVQSHAAMLADSNTSALLGLFKRVYEQHRPDLVKVQSIIKIPRYLHTVWLGGKLPDCYQQFYQSWSLYHPHWTHIFWTDSPANYDYGTIVCTSFEQLQQYLDTHKAVAGARIVVDTSHLAFDNKIFFDASRNYGERSDILKWEIVFRFGGVYVDTDFECLRPLDELHFCYDFYTGLQPLDTKYVQLGAALFAAMPGHPIMAACVNGIRDNQNIVPIVVKTGPIHFTRSFLTHIADGNYINIAFPASYFYPRGYDEREMPVELWQKNEAFAVHHWAGSWIKPEGFVHA